MSGIYISGMNMPENYRHMILMANGDVTDIDGTKIANAIELPPHGRLIDADVLEIYQMEENVRADGDPNEYEYDAGLIDGLHMAAKDVSVAPTILPADPEKEDK